MKVLLCDPEVVSTIGGGQRVYNQLIRSNPNIEFHTFLRASKPLPKGLPKNLVVRSFKPTNPGFAPSTIFNGALLAQWIFDRAFDAREIASQVAGESFDVADLPDYYAYGFLLRPAFEQFGAKVKKIALAMHGNCSTTHAMEWSENSTNSISSNISEFLQYRAVDIRYALSKRYKKEWEALAPESVHYIDPLNFLKLPQPISSWKKEGKCNLVFIGRPEKRKGPDLFLEILKKIPKELYDRAMLVGPDSGYNKRLGAKQYLVLEAQKYGLKLEDIATKNDSELTELLSQRTIIFAPSRYDTFNLVAIESLFAACPTAIGTGAGVVDFLAERAPNLPWLSINPDKIELAIEPLINIIKNYDYYRGALKTELGNLMLKPQGPGLEGIFNQPAESCSEVNELCFQWYHEYKNKFCEYNNHVALSMRATGNRLSRTLVKNFQINANNLDTTYESLSVYKEENPGQILEKLKVFWDLSDTEKFDRVRVWNEIGRLERMRGNLNLWATYKLRSMRALDQVDAGNLSDLIKALSSLGFLREAEALRAAQSEESALSYLESSYSNNKSLPEFEFNEMLDFRHASIEPKVSIIVSLYNAADKLGYFLQRISEQTIFSSKLVEIILVDSASPKNEKEAFQRFHAEHALPILYVRSKNRETIQTAWNRGISLSRAPYLCFLGVDETLRPDCLEVLSKLLDQESGLDWIIGDSVITEVDKDGQFVKKGMIYNRQNYQQDLVQLETCYLSWVGALYRKSIHTRFGYYDGSFKAAGDTEFKNRILSKINSKAIPEMLGIFLNYPDERTTASPVAEIEDSRAWYLHRSLAGVHYCYANRSTSDLEAQIIRSLGYRKSYLDSNSTDFLYANALLKQLERVSPGSELLGLRSGIDKLLKCFTRIEFLKAPNAIRISQARFEIQQVMAEVQQQHSQITARNDLLYRIELDNRYQQHHWPWRDEKAFGNHQRGYRHVWL